MGDTVTATTSVTDTPTITARDPLSPLPPPNPVMVMPTMVTTVTLMPTDTVTLTLTDTVTATISARDPLNPDTDMPTMVITDTLMPTVVITDTLMVMASKFILSLAVCRYLLDTAVLYASLIRRILICDPQYLKSSLA